MKLQVIIPVGPGHEGLCNRATDSVTMAMDQGKGPFETVQILRVDDARGEIGRSAARNRGVERSSCDWIFFLDADDLMHPDCFRNVSFAFSMDGGERDAYFGTITELVGGNVVERYQVPRIETYEQLLDRDPFLTIKMGHFVRRNVALNTPFDVSMDTGEDWDYYLRLWRRYKCRKVASPFFIKCKGQHSTGPRSATGRQWNEAVDKIIGEARREWTRTQRTSQ